MVLNIPDEVMKSAGLTEEEARIGFACWLYDADRISMFEASRMCGLSRDEFQAELMERGLPVFRYTVEEFRADMETLKRLGI